MRLLLAVLWNLLLAIGWTFSAPFRLLRCDRPVDFVQFRIKGSPPYRPVKRRGWLGKRGATDPDVVGSIHALEEWLKKLVRDPRVQGVVLILDGFEGPSAKREAILEQLNRFKASGKKVVGYATQAGNEAYALLAAADRVILSPAARLDLRGYAAEASSLGGVFELFGVKAEFIRRGAYKTAPELFTHRELSDIQRETLERFLDERYAALVASLVEGRKLPLARAQAAVDGGPYSARKALREGLCDSLGSEADLPQLLGTEAKEARIENSSGYRRSLRLRAPNWARLRRRPKLGVVPLHGMIVDGEGGGVPGGPKMAGAESLRKLISRAASDRKSKALLLYINSPGGSALGSELLLEEVKRAAKKKPIVAFFDQVAASGGYMALLGAKEVWATPHAVAGSIGVFGGKFDLSGLFGKLGIRRTVITRGRNAAIYSSSKSFDESERRAMEETIEDTYQAFLAHVAEGRKMTVEEVHARGEGRVFSGARALEQRLVDRIGGFEEAAARAMELAGGGGKPFDVHAYSPSSSRLSFLRSFQNLLGAGVYALAVELVLELG